MFRSVECLIKFHRFPFIAIVVITVASIGLLALFVTVEFVFRENRLVKETNAKMIELDF